MFPVCMISDNPAFRFTCWPVGGRSLTMIFSDGFGVQFDVFYAGSMVIATRSKNQLSLLPDCFCRTL